MLAFYMDHHVHRAITEGLRRHGIDISTALEDAAETLDDESLLARATELNRILVTQDKGFLRIGAQWQRAHRDFAGIVFVVQEQMDIGRAIEYLELIAHVMPADEMRNHVEHIPLGV